MEEEIQSLCPKIWDVVDVERQKFLQGWLKIQEYAEEATSIPLNVKLLLAAVGFYDPVMLATLTEKEIGIAESCTRSLMVSGVSCGQEHNCEELVRKSLWGGHYNRPQTFQIKPGYKNVLLFITKTLKKGKGMPINERSTPTSSCGEGENSEICNKEFLLRKVNKWIVSKNADSRILLVTEITLSAPRKAEILCPFCVSAIQVTLHDRRWVISNFQKHYDRHIGDVPIKKRKKMQESILELCKLEYGEQGSTPENQQKRIKEETGIKIKDDVRDDPLFSQESDDEFM
ncbi:uncharacterized protein LOC132262633 [Phlebotomus argentipes]|uniref:uncharacterized protein LOC132262633 n=1 Tax=Phlebotomus argentipes TaxID=94469 RepID=UPI0028935D5B|nr:uncharacterized protein LOC132262633 [Phlebotomus argentipes]